MDGSRRCYAVQLSKKKGNDALQLCPDPKGHGGINSAVHKHPPKFNLDYIYKNFTRAPTKEESKLAGWVPQKKKKA